jgi:hypothetical protein
MIHFNKILAIAILLLLSISTAHAQAPIPCTITLNDGTTQTGTTVYNDRKTTAQSILFKNASGQETTYNNTALSAFELTRKDGKKERFVRKTVQITRPYVDNLGLGNTPKQKMTTETLFLQWLLESPQGIGLLEMVDLEQAHYFMAQDSVVELVYKVYTKTSTKPTESQTEQTTHYRRQLIIAAYNYPELIPKIWKLPYEASPIMAILKAINTKKNAPNTYTLQYQKWKPQLYILAGFTNSTINPKGDASLYPQYLKTSFSSSVKPSFGIGFGLHIPRSKGRMWLYTEANTHHLKTENAKKGTVFTNGIEESFPYQRFDLQWLRTSTSFRWIFYQKRVKSYLQLGPTFSFLLNDNSTEVTGFALDKKLKPLWDGNIDKTNFGYLAGLGGSVGRIGLEFRYNYDFSFSPFRQLLIPVKSYSLLLSVRI